MILTIKNKVTTTPTTLPAILQFLEDSWPFALAMGTIWKTISELAKIYDKKQEAKLRALIKSEVTPTFDRLQESMDRLADSIDKMKYGPGK